MGADRAAPQGSLNVWPTLSRSGLTPGFARMRSRKAAPCAAAIWLMVSSRLTVCVVGLDGEGE